MEDFQIDNRYYLGIFSNLRGRGVGQKNKSQFKFGNWLFPGGALLMKVNSQTQFGSLPLDYSR